MTLSTEYLPEAERDVRRLDGSQLKVYDKAIRKLVQNPLPGSEGGYDKPLGNRAGTKLSGLLKVKLRSLGIRVVYKADRERLVVLVVVVGDRADEEVYRLAAQRIAGHPELL